MRSYRIDYLNPKTNAWDTQTVHTTLDTEEQCEDWVESYGFELAPTGEYLVTEVETQS